MTDSYLPALAEFTLSGDENAVVASALQKDDPWDSSGNNALNEIKKRIQQFHLQRHDFTCCYCREGLRGRGHFTMDREHILPKSKYKNLTFEISNLSVSCKRCNMEYKGDNVTFVIDPDTIETDHADSARYRFVHPNFDKWEDHLRRTSIQLNTVELVVFSVTTGSEKGRFTYDFFRFDRYCAEALDLAQGISRLDQQGRNMLQDLSALMHIELP